MCGATAFSLEIRCSSMDAGAQTFNLEVPQTYTEALPKNYLLCPMTPWFILGTTITAQHSQASITKKRTTRALRVKLPLNS